MKKKLGSAADGGRACKSVEVPVMGMEQRSPDGKESSKRTRERRVTTPTISLQELRRRIYCKAKSDNAHRFWGLYGHVARMDVLWEAYREAKANGGAHGTDGQTFDKVEAMGVEGFLLKIREELLTQSYRPLKPRAMEIPKSDGGTRTLKIPAIRDRVVQGAVKLILEPIFEADFRESVMGYRPGRNPEEALERVSKAVMKYGLKTIVDVDLKSYFDGIRHHRLLGQLARRVSDGKVLWLIKRILKGQGKAGVSQGSPLSPLLSNVYLMSVDEVFEKAEETTRWNGSPRIIYTRYADDIVIAVGYHPRWPGLAGHVVRRLKEELGKMEVALNSEKTKVVNLKDGGSFAFMGFDCRRILTRKGKYCLWKTPRMRKRTLVLQAIRDIIRKARRWTVRELIQKLNPVIAGWVNYYRIGNASTVFKYIRNHVELRVRRFAMRRRQRHGFGWKKWSKRVVYGEWGLFSDYKIRTSYYKPSESEFWPIGA